MATLLHRFSGRSTIPTTTFDKPPLVDTQKYRPNRNLPIPATIPAAFHNSDAHGCPATPTKIATAHLKPPTTTDGGCPRPLPHTSHIGSTAAHTLQLRWVVRLTPQLDNAALTGVCTNTVPPHPEHSLARTTSCDPPVKSFAGFLVWLSSRFSLPSLLAALPFDAALNACECHLMAVSMNSDYHCWHSSLAVPLLPPTAELFPAGAG